MDARNTTAQEIADKAGVSPCTVRNRIDHLEEIGGIECYRPNINGEAANFPLQVLFGCTTAAEERAERVE